jgi:uncharacterized protein (UPF0332 family)
MTGGDFLTLAFQLAAGTTEAEWRSAVSRAYYAAFHVARDLLTDLGFTVPRADQAHEYLYRRLNNCGNVPVRQAAVTLHELRRHRNRADYDLKAPHSAAGAAGDTAGAEQVIQALAAAAAEPVRTQLIDAMKDYERNVLRQVTWTP